MRRSLAEIEDWQSLTNAYSQVLAGQAEMAALEQDATPSSGPLAGVPFAVKDLFDVAGHPTTGCSRFYADNIATSTAPVVQRVLDAGGILVGKTNQHELAMGGTNVVSACGPTHNPFDLDRITGGSSGGSAAAVATRTVPIALGTDTGGSIRNPSSMCGLFGLKPTNGKVSSVGVMPLSPSLDCPGPMAADAQHLALLWRVMSGSDDEPREVTRVGVLDGHFSERVHPAVRAAIAATVDALRELGIEIVDVDGQPDPAFDLWGDFVCMEFIEAHPALLDGREKLFERTASFVDRGASLSPAEREHLRTVPDVARRWFAQRLDGVDVLLAPSAPYPAPRATDDEVDVGGGQTVDVHLGGTSRFTRPVNLAGCPAITIPAGMSEGLPIGIQLIGRVDDEATLISLAASLEASGDRFCSPTPPDPRTAAAAR